jgi:hypothetical protein
MNVDKLSRPSSGNHRADYDIFISYSRRDKEFVSRLWEALEKANQNAWVDWDDIPPTADWRQEIYLGIEAANNFVFVISPHSIQSVVCGEELAHAILHGKRLIPIVWQDVDYQAVHPELAKLNWIFFREVDNFEHACQTLLEAIETDLNHVRSHTRLLVRAREWDNKQRDPSFLLRGSDLEAGEQWLNQSDTKKPQPTPLHQDYINISRQAETERQEQEIRLHRITPHEYRNRQALLNKVRNYWIKGVLENALQNRVSFELRLEERPQAVTHPWNLTVETPDSSPQLLPPGTKIIDLFDAIGLGRTLLILGKPGSGKTTTLLELARDLVNRAEQDIGQPIPVVFNLSSWDDEKQTIYEWLVREFNLKYQVPKKIGQTWINQQQILLLLDGMDEVQADYREASIQALNKFHQQYGLEIIVTSRIHDYEVLSQRLNFQRAVYLKSLTLEQIHQSLEGQDSYLAGLRDLLFKDGMLLHLAKSPLMFKIMTLAYQEVAIEDLPETALLEQRRQQLFDAYIERMFKRRAANQDYSQSQTLHWLIWLAQRMCQFSQTVFLIEGIQPTSLQTPIQQRIYRMSIKLMVGVIWGSLHVGLLAGLSDSTQSFNWFKGLEGWLLGLMGGLLYGVIGGWLGKFVNESTNHWIGRSINGLVLGIIFAPIFYWIYRWQGAIAYGLIYGLIGVIIYGFIHNHREIEPVYTLKWSWRKAGQYSVFGLAIGLVLHLGAGEQLIPSLVFGVMLSLILGFEKANEVVDKQVEPNQSIWKSAQNAGKLFITIGLLTGLLLGIVVNPIYGLVNGLLFGLASALIGGGGVGITCLKHFVLRCILWKHGSIPWNYARFLDYASDRILLQKVGGGYVFIHRWLLEHFAQIP